MTFHTFSINGLLEWMLADMQTNCQHLSVHVQWFSHQNNGADYRVIIKCMSQESLVHKWKGSIKGEAQLNSRSLAADVLSSGCLDIHFRVFY